MSQLVLDSLRRRMRAMHSLWEECVATMELDQVNHVEREPVLPIAFSLFHLVRIEDFSATMLGAGDMVYDDAWGERMGLAIKDDGKARTPEEMVHQRIGDYEAFKEYMATVFDKTESFLASLDPSALDRVAVPKPYPESIASTYSARVGGDEGITVLDGLECWIYQHGLRHMGEIEHARALVGLEGMTS
ncbi:MAG: hypothetical protein U5K30_14730 [Acidimicrobiales bacterium]|nr:hypothetical protein [Acidimicrobiales bacterium]